ncbi:TPA: DUF550 domain-containing protein [Citrobacter freundii]|nr:DUF550 domain-containing protein [Citrobacter freundii]HEG1879809.1 DUF550 domain-containing protein [Citrobacter freundii]
MTALNKLTDGQLLFRLQDFYGAEQDAIKINDHEYAQECSDIVSVIREVMESRKALEAAEKRIAELEAREGKPVMFIDGDISASDAEKLAAVIREWDDAPAPERDRVRREHAEWSLATFGDVGPVGPLKHLSKEALEAAAEPGDLSEWADMQFLLWDAQRRAGISDEQINQAMVEKLVVNKQRKWPEPKDGEPRLHIKEQPAPVVPDEMVNNINNPYGDEDLIYEEGKIEGWNACRAAMLQAGNSPVTPDGWVACVERMPSAGEQVLAYRPDAPESNDPLIKMATYVGGSAHGHGFDCYCKPTHWMPLPAAPQQEVKP